METFPNMIFKKELLHYGDYGVNLYEHFENDTVNSEIFIRLKFNFIP